MPLAGGTLVIEIIPLCKLVDFFVAALLCYMKLFKFAILF